MSSSSKRRRQQTPRPIEVEATRPAESMPLPPPPPRPVAPPRAEERLGDILRRVREHRHESLDYIAEYLRIRPNFLFSIENSRYDELPADAYVIGFLRTYANYLGLDGKAAIDQYRKEMAGRRKKPQLSMPQPVSEGRAPTVAIMIVATILALLIYATWYGLSSTDRAVETAAPVLPTTTQPVAAATTTTPAPIEPTTAVTPVVAPTATTGVTVPTAAPVAATAPVTTAPAVTTPTTPNNTTATPATAATDTSAQPATTTAGKTFGVASAHPRLTIRAEKESWILVFDKTGSTVFDHILKPGETYNAPDIKGLKLTTGNGGGVILTLEGKELPRLAADSRIVRNIPLDTDALKASVNAP